MDIGDFILGVITGMMIEILIIMMAIIIYYVPN
jgi:hypothetical protein